MARFAVLVIVTSVPCWGLRETVTARNKIQTELELVIQRTSKFANFLAQDAAALSEGLRELDTVLRGRPAVQKDPNSKVEENPAPGGATDAVTDQVTDVVTDAATASAPIEPKDADNPAPEKADADAQKPEDEGKDTSTKTVDANAQKPVDEEKTSEGGATVTTDATAKSEDSAGAAGTNESMSSNNSTNSTSAVNQTVFNAAGVDETKCGGENQMKCTWFNKWLTLNYKISKVWGIVQWVVVLFIVILACTCCCTCLRRMTSSSTPAAS